MNRKTQVLCMICMTILMLFLGATYVEGYKTARSYMRSLNVEGMKFSDNDYMSGIDENTGWQEDYYKISGWAIHVGDSSTDVKMHIVLRDTDSKIFYELPSYLQSRNDVMDALNLKDGIDHSKCGVGGTARLSQIHGTYHIYILYQTSKEDTLVDTGKEFTCE